MAAGLYDITSETLGKGHFAVVKLARHCLTGELVAVKIIDKMKLKKEGLRQLGLEIKLLSRLSEKEHPNIVKLYQVIDTKTKLYLVMEYPGKDVCDLYDYIDRKSSKGLKENEARHIFRQICSAIHYCHSLRIVHRDLKPENILIVNQPSDCNMSDDGHQYPLVKLIDFGFSNQWDEGEKLRTSCGSLAYSAPEILLGDYYDGDKVDIWGLGCILYILLYGYNPFMQINDSETLIKILDCSFTTPRRPSICDSSIHLIKSLLQRDPNSRLTISEVLDHIWLKGSKEDDGNGSEDGVGGNESNAKDDISAGSPHESNDLTKSSVKLNKTESNIHDKVIDHMVSQGMCSSKDHVESALKKTRDRVNRTKSSELITSPVEISVQLPLPMNGEKLNESKSSQDNYVTATYHLLKDKLVRELHHNNLNSTSSSESPQSKEKHHLKSRRQRKPLVQQAPRLRPSFGSPLRDSSNDKSNNKLNQLEVSSSEDDQSFVLPLARKCSIVSEEGSCAGTDISGNDGPNDGPLLEIGAPLFEIDQPPVDIIVTDFSDNDPKSVDECIEEGEDEIDSFGLGNEASEGNTEHQKAIQLKNDDFTEKEEGNNFKSANVNYVKDETSVENENANTDKAAEEFSSRLLKTSSTDFVANQLHLVSSSPELLREDDYTEFCNDQNDLSSADVSESTPDPVHLSSHRIKNSLTNATCVTASPTMILADTRNDSKNDIGDHVINHFTYNSKSTTNGGSSTATSLRIIVQSKSCNNILFGDEDKSCLPCNTSSSSAVSKSRKGLSSNYRMSSLLKRNKSDKADCCSIC